MGGFGSGRQYGRTRVEECRSIDVRNWNRKDLIKNGNGFSWCWYDDQGKQASSIGVMVKENAVELAYKVNQSENMHYRIQLSHSDCNYGGERVWFICPNTHCYQRVAKLYLKQGIFACRHCHQLTYRSSQQSGNPTDEAINAIWRIQQKLGYSKGDIFTVPAKPKHMHWSTYLKILNKLNKAQGKQAGAFLDKMRKLVGM